MKDKLRHYYYHYKAELKDLSKLTIKAAYVALIFKIIFEVL